MPEVRSDDAVPVARIARGDKDAFAAIYDRYLPLVLRWSLRETGNREIAADLAAETFAAALIASPRYRPGKGSVGAWLLGISRNKLRESRRRRRVEDSARRRVGLDAVAFDDADFERVDELISVDSGMVELLEALPPALREAIALRVIEERSYEEIAEQLRCSESLVRQRVSRGLRTLRIGAGGTMSDYFSTVRHELANAVERRAHLRWYQRLRVPHSRSMAIVLAALVVAAPAVAAVAGWFGSRASPTRPVPSRLEPCLAL